MPTEVQSVGWQSGVRNARRRASETSCATANLDVWLNGQALVVVVEWSSCPGGRRGQQQRQLMP